MTLALLFLEICKFFQDSYLIERLRTLTSDRGFFLEVFRKFKKILKSTNEKNASGVYCPYCDSEEKLAQAV